MANLKISNQELETLLGELEGELGSYLSDAKAKLSKAREEDGSPSPGMGGASASGSSPSSAGSPSAGSPSPEGEGSPGMEGAPPAEGAAPEGAPGEEGAEGIPGEEGGAPGEEGPVDPAALEAEYAKLPPEELKAHYLACKAALFAVMGGEGASAGAPGASPAPAPAPAPSAAPAGPPPAGLAMGEMSASSASSPSAYSKSEVDDIKNQLEAVTKILSGIVGKPMRKAVTGTDYVPKSDAPVAKISNPAEITAKLSELTRDPSLKKSDRELITGYYEGRFNVNAIEHLLK